MDNWSLTLQENSGWLRKMHASEWSQAEGWERVIFMHQRERKKKGVTFLALPACCTCEQKYTVEIENKPSDSQMQIPELEAFQITLR